MFSRDSWGEILQMLTANMFRTMLTAFGVCWGIFILMVLLAAGRGLENGVKQGFGNIATNTLYLWGQSTVKPYKGLPEGRMCSFILGDIQSLEKQVSGIKYISPRNQLGNSGTGQGNLQRRLKSSNANIFGDYPEIIHQNSIKVTSGRFLNYGDIQSNRKVAVISEEVLRELYDKAENPLGSYIKVQGMNFLVIGTSLRKSKTGNSRQSRQEIYIPFTTFGKAFNSGEKVGWFAITAQDQISVTSLKPQILQILKERRTIHPKDDHAIGNFDLYKEFNKINSLFIVLKIVAFFVGFLMLISGIIGVSNNMLIIVKERTNEFGIRRALGATPAMIRSQIILESIILTMISGMVGVIFGTVLIYLINLWQQMQPKDTEMMFVNPEVSVLSVLVALGVLIFSGVLAGILPAQTAINIKPIDALRFE